MIDLKIQRVFEQLYNEKSFYFVKNIVKIDAEVLRKNGFWGGG